MLDLPRPLLLASASPRRQDLLAGAGIRFEAHPVDVDEQWRPGESPSAYVRRLAVEKAARAMGEDADAAAGRRFVLGADTTVVVDDAVLGKPESEAEAARMLRRLSGRAHDVLTGVSLRLGARAADAVETTRVWFRPLSEAEVLWYARTGEGRDKAGGYAIQGLASRFIPRIDGSYSNVVGLPVATVVALFQQLDGEPPAVASGR